MNDRLLKARDAAQILGLSESTLAKMRLSGAGPHYIKLGRSVRYLPSAVEKWVQARSRQSTSDAASEHLPGSKI
jgi:predicted DNA-binding transcriptional regulator AlpA